MLRKVRERLRTLRTRAGSQANNASANAASSLAPSATVPQRMWTFGRRRERDPESISGATSRMDSASSPLRTSSPNRSARIADKLKLARRPRALVSPAEVEQAAAMTNAKAPRQRMLPPPPATQGFSIRKTSEISIPSFLNDSVPVEPIPSDERNPSNDQNDLVPDVLGDNYRLKRASDADNDFINAKDEKKNKKSIRPSSPTAVQPQLQRALSANVGPNAPISLLDGLSAPLSYGATATESRRSTVWKAEPDHSHKLARDASMAVTHEERVDAAHALTAAAEKQATNLELAVGALKSSVDIVREEARLLPSTRMPRYERLMFTTAGAGGSMNGNSIGNTMNDEIDASHHEHEEKARSLRDLGWSEKVWDIESMLAERRLDAAVTAIESLLSADHDHSFEHNQPIPTHVAGLVDEISGLLVARSPFDCAEKAKEHAQLLVRLGKADLGCTVIERTAEDLFHAKLSRLQPASGIDLARYVHTVLQLTCASLEETHTALASIPLDDVARAERIVAWSTSQTDKVYRAFIRSCISHARGLDGGALLQIVSAIHARAATETSGEDAYPPFSGAAAALFRARLLSNLRAHLRDIAHDTREALGRFTLGEVSASWPPREAQTLVRSVDAVASALAPVLRELPALDEGEFDAVFTYVIITYAAGSAPDDNNENRNRNDAQILAFLGKNINVAMKKNGMCAPRTLKAAEWLVSGNKDRVAQEVIRIAANSEANGLMHEDARGSVGVTKLMVASNNGEDHVLEDTLSPLANETVLREKARQMLRVSATVAVA